MVKKIKRKSKKGRGKSSGSGSHPQAKLPGRFATEHLNRLIVKILSEHEFEDIDEANAFLQAHIVGHPIEEIKAKLGSDPLEEAQELAFQAMDADDPDDAVELTKRSLELDPDCVDAQGMAAALSSRSGTELIDKLELILEAAEARFGREFFEENKGHFWGVVETRALIRVGETEKAIGHCEAMIELNPGDNQGIRDILLGLYFETGNLEGVRKLFEQYPDDFMPSFLWAKVLERYLSGDLKSAKRALRKAQKSNTYVKDLLTGKEPPPERFPDHYSPGDISEALVCFRHLAPAWQKRPEAIEWLESQS